jgi:hypothetical protein
MPYRGTFCEYAANLLEKASLTRAVENNAGHSDVLNWNFANLNWSSPRVFRCVIIPFIE